MDNFTPEQIEQFLEQFFDAVGRRQYIGARYVPIFGRKDESSIEWDNTKPYEPLTIVLYQGNSYTSRTYVPTGVAITDTSYWANTGNYNAQIEQYRREVLDFSQAIIEKTFSFDTVNSMKDSTNLYDGAICHTNGFHSSGDGGAAWYKITQSATYIPNGMDVILCGTFKAVLLKEKITVPEMYGAKGDGTTDDYSILQHIIDNVRGHVEFIAEKTYAISHCLTLYNNPITPLMIYGNNSTIKVISEIPCALSWGEDTGLYYSGEYSRYQKVELHDLRIQCQNLTRVGVCAQGCTWGKHLTNIQVSDSDVGFAFGGNWVNEWGGMRAFRCNIGFTNKNRDSNNAILCTFADSSGNTSVINDVLFQALHCETCVIGADFMGGYQNTFCTLEAEGCSEYGIRINQMSCCINVIYTENNAETLQADVHLRSSNSGMNIGILSASKIYAYGAIVINFLDTPNTTQIPTEILPWESGPKDKPIVLGSGLPSSTPWPFNQQGMFTLIEYRREAITKVLPAPNGYIELEFITVQSGNPITVTVTSRYGSTKTFELSGATGKTNGIFVSGGEWFNVSFPAVTNGALVNTIVYTSNRGAKHYT